MPEVPDDTDNAASTRKPIDQPAGPTVTDQLLVESQVRSILKCGHSTFYKLIADGSLKTVKIGRRRYVRDSDLAEFIRGLS